MRYFIENDEVVSKMTMAAKQRFENYFTAGIMGKAYLTLYQMILDKNKL